MNSRTISRGRRLALGCVILGVFALPASASAAVTCDFSGGELEVDVTDGTASAVLSRAASPATEVLVDTNTIPGDGTVACTGGTPTLTTTSEIDVDETASTQGTFLILDFARGRLEPGLGAETGPEIEVTFTADGDGEDVFEILADNESAEQSFRFGAVTGGATGGELTADANDAADDASLVGVDRLFVAPGTGNDTVTLDGSGDAAFTAPTPADLVTFASDGNDTFASGDGDSNGVNGGLDDDSLTGGPGADSFDMAEGNDSFNGAGGTVDFASYENHPSIDGITLDLGQAGPQNTVGFGVDQVANVESIVGTNGPDELTGTNDANTIFGGNVSNDAGDDVLSGLGGADSLFARDGDDILIGGQGDDLLDGEDGVDTASFAVDSDGPVSFDLDPGLTGVVQATGGADGDTLDDGPAAGVDHEMENITGSPFAGDDLTGNAGPNTIDVHDGFADTIDCLGGSDEAITDEVGVDAVALCGTEDNAPQTSIASGPANGAAVSTRTPTYSLTADEPSSFAVSVDGGPFTPCAASCSPPPLADGVHTLAFHAVDDDENGNEDLTPAGRTVTVDATAPQTSAALVKFKPKLKKGKQRVSFTVSSDDPAAKLECSMDGAAFAACASGISFKVRPGRHKLAARATDAVGNVDATPATVAFRVKKAKRKKK